MPRFAEELARWGPHTQTSPPGLTDARAYCRRLARGHYENFPVITRLLPRRLRDPFAAVYAWCRWADDLGDEISDADRSLRLLEWWRTELHRTYNARPQHPVTVALQPVIEDFAIPSHPFERLLTAFEQDQRITRYETFADLEAYCRHSANPVGHLVLYLCEAFTQDAALCSDSICTGLQLTNFWQDVARDYTIGRVYIPTEDRHRFAYTDDHLQRRETTAEFQRLMQFEVDRARGYLERGLPVLEFLSGRLKWVVALFAAGGLRVLELIEGLEYRVWEDRPRLHRLDAVRLMLRARRLVSRGARSSRAWEFESSEVRP